jgi:hypothetical protein
MELLGWCGAVQESPREERNRRQARCWPMLTSGAVVRIPDMPAVTKSLIRSDEAQLFPVDKCIHIL